MKKVDIKSNASKDKILSYLKNCELVNSRVKFDAKNGKPTFFVKEKKNFFTVKCQYQNDNVKDGGFLEGTYFIGRIIEKDGISNLKGIILTAPIYHSILLTIMAIYIVRSFVIGGFNPVPAIMFIFSIVMFRNEFGKQGVIERYLHRAVKKSSETQEDD